MSGYGLVLAGGGAKGAYQMGAWKALKEMNISFDAIAGASIGSINGALIAQGDYDKAMEMWESVSIDKGVNITEALPDPENLFSKKNWGILFKEFINTVKNSVLGATRKGHAVGSSTDAEAVVTGERLVIGDGDGIRTVLDGNALHFQIFLQFFFGIHLGLGVACQD